MITASERIETNEYLERIADLLEWFVDQKIESDKVLCGILKTMNNREEIKWNQGEIMAGNETDQGVVNAQSTDIKAFMKVVNEIHEEMLKNLSRLAGRVTALEAKEAVQPPPAAPGRPPMTERDT